MPESKLLILCYGDGRYREIAKYFEESGYDLICSHSYSELVDMIRRDSYQASMLILGMDAPGRTEYETIDRIREYTDIPVLILSADGRLETQLYAYSKGIDDYMVMPVPLPLIEAHVEAVLSRMTKKKHSVITAGALTVDYESRKIYLGDQIMKVTTKEFDLMEFFVQHKGMILSRDKILDAVWGFDYVGGYRSVDTLVKKLRAKLTKEYPYIQTVYGVGYCFDV